MSRVMNSNERRRAFIKFFLSDALILPAVRNIVVFSLQTVAIEKSNLTRDFTRLMCLAVTFGFNLAFLYIASML